MYEKELREELVKIWDDSDFVLGALCHLKTDEERKEILDGIRSGELKDYHNLFDRIMEIAGFATSCDEENEG